jgi:hypothetical protein
MTQTPSKLQNERPMFPFFIDGVPSERMMMMMTKVMTVVVVVTPFCF